MFRLWLMVWKRVRFAFASLFFVVLSASGQQIQYNPNTPWAYYLQPPKTAALPQGFSILFGRVVFSQNLTLPYATIPYAQDPMVNIMNGYAARADAEERFSQFLDYVRSIYPKGGPVGFDNDMLTFVYYNNPLYFIYGYRAIQFVLLPALPAQ